MPDTHSPKTPAWPPKSAPRLFVPAPLSAGTAIAIEGQQAHYLARGALGRPGGGLGRMGVGH